MSIKIKLARTGKKNTPMFRVVVSQTKTKRNGRFLDVLGHFDPLVSKNIKINKEKLESWIKKGAELTNSVKKALDGNYVYTKYSPKIEKTQNDKGSPKDTVEKV